MSIDNMYAALMKIAKEDDEYKDLGVDMKSDETGVEKKDKERKKRRENGFFPTVGTGIAAGTIGTLGLAAATPRGRKMLKDVKGGIENAIAKVINKVRENEAPKSLASDYALVPALAGDLAGGLMWNRAYGTWGIPSTSKLVRALENAREHIAPQAGIPGVRDQLERAIADARSAGVGNDLINQFRDAADNIHSDPGAVNQLRLIDDAIAELRTPLRSRTRIAGRGVFGGRSRNLLAFNRRIFDNPRLQEALLDVDKDLGGMPVPMTQGHSRRIFGTGHLHKGWRRALGYGGAAAILGGNIWSAINMLRNYEKQKGRAH